jgi:MoxR-like ATPase
MMDGRLVPATKTNDWAKSCSFSMLGPQRQNTNGVRLIPALDDAFTEEGSGGIWNPVTELLNSDGKKNIIEPSEYNTDKPVSAAEEKAGIRAWRRINDPKQTGNCTYLPIYRQDFFSAEAQAMIPKTGDDEHPELYLDHMGICYSVAVFWIEVDETPTLWGMPGTGKTEFYRWMAWQMGLPFVRISVTETSEVDDLIGKMMFSKDKGTYFQEGRLTVAWQSPCVLVLDEPNAGPPAVWHALRPITDSSKQLANDQDTGKPIPRHPDCYLGFAMNPAWDSRNTGVQNLAAADGSRLVHIYMSLPPKEIEEEIIRARCQEDGYNISKSMLSKILGITHDIRQLVDTSETSFTWGVRETIKVARCSRWFDLVTTFRRAVTDSLEPEASQSIINVVKTYV